MILLSFEKENELKRTLKGNFRAWGIPEANSFEPIKFLPK